MENEKIQLPLYLGVKIQERLREKYGIETDNRNFSREELDLVDELTVVPPIEGELEGIEQLRNIEKLVIESVGNTSFQTECISSISSKDIQSITQCNNLRELSIINQSKIETLDCSKFKGLTSLTIKNNRKLQEINGLEDLSRLEEFCCYGNESLQSISNLGDIIVENDELIRIELDMMLFPDAINFSRISGFYDDEPFEKLKKVECVSKAVFVQSMLKKEVNITCEKMMQLHQKAMQILIENSIDGTDAQIAENIEKYIDKNTEYIEDYKMQTTDNKDNKPIVGARSSSNGAYNVLINGKGNVEGYTKAMQYLLKLKDINSRSVYCIEKSQDQDEENKYQSVVFLEDENLYANPAKSGLALKNRKDMQKIYQFDGIHLSNEISNNVLRDLGARIGGVRSIERELKETVNSKEVTKEKEVDYGYERGDKKSIC